MGLPRVPIAGAALALAGLAASAGIVAGVSLYTVDVLAAGAPAPATAAAAASPGSRPAAVHDERLSAIAGALTGAPVRVDCVSRAELARRAERPDAWGLAESGIRRVSLLSPFCGFLAGVRGARPALPAYHAGPALLVFVHELEHVRGARAEGLAECRALRDLDRFARSGFGVADAAWLSDARAAALQEHARTPASYRGTRC